MRRTVKCIFGVTLALSLIFSAGCGKKATVDVSSTESTTAKADSEQNTKESANNNNNNNQTVVQEGTIDVDVSTLPYSQETLYSQLFDINNKIEIDVNISDEELQKMQNDYNKYDKQGSKSPIYRKCDVAISITTGQEKNTYLIKNVGVRMKGNTSRTDFYDKSRGIYSYIHFKLDFQECFDDTNYYGGDSDYNLNIDVNKQKKRTFATLDSLEIKWNQTWDQTYIREYYAYEMYRDFGILSPRTNIASMDFAGIHEGVFKIYEPVDKKFIERNLPEEDWGGDLYKCGWTNEGASFVSNVSYGIEDKENGKFYNYDLKTNKKSSQHESFKALISFLNGKSVTKENLEKYVDMDYFMTYAAVSFFAGNPDDMRNNYNNYYIYFLKSNNKMVIIPYDNDRCFGVTLGYNPSGDAMTGVKSVSQRAVGNGGSNQKNPLINYTVARNGYYLDEFASKLEKVATSKWMTTDYFNSIYDVAKMNYANDAAPDKEMDNAEGYIFKFDSDCSNGLYSDNGNASFKDYVEAKLKFYNENK